jgi:tetratricopeptide (TPR) repeat protein
MKPILNSFLIAFIFVMSANAQITKPSLSPKISKSTQIGLANVALEYGQPSANDRTVFGALIPYGKLWRTGANGSTKFSTDRDIIINNQHVPVGAYALYTIPNMDSWTIVIHKNTKLWGAGNYDAKDDLVRFDVPVINTKDYQETLDIHFEGFHADGGHMVIAWERTKVSIPIHVDSNALIMAEIKEKLINAKGEIKAQTYFDAAQYYYYKNVDLEQAALWFDKAVEMRPSAFWFIYYRAELAHTMQQNTLALKLVNQALDMAKKSPSGDYGYIAKSQLLKAKIEK